ncbi:MAG: hypothetical protein JO010_06950 [Alphaproteobacteria bacterium]|nr:hypothetical protein [Alphaproteobacteria bacterium]
MRVGHASGRALIAAGFEDDVALAAAHDASAAAPRLHDGAFIAAAPG